MSIARTRIGTGSPDMLTRAQIINLDGWSLFGPIGQTCHTFDAGGPLDAPDVMPAGSVNSVDCVRGPWSIEGGTACPAQTTIVRSP